MKASVIIPTKNPGAIFKRVLPMVLEQETPWDYEILVIDSGSTDGTIEYCKSFGDRVRLHQIKPEEFGHGKTRNLGIAMTSGEFAVMLTHDATPLDNFWLKNLVKAVEADPQIAGAFGRHKAYEDAGPFITRDLEGMFNGFKATNPVITIEDKERYMRDVHYRQLLHFFSDNNSCLRRSVWQKIPYPDVDFAEDQLWAKAIIEAGYKKAYADDAVVYHSHTFGAVETFRRSFDESYAFLRYFGYIICPSFAEVIGKTGYLSLRDCKYSLRQGINRHNLYWTVRAPFDNLARHSGHYLGQYAKKLPLWMIDRISRDRSLKRGTSS
jgi:rhamnosyltransferase